MDDFCSKSGAVSPRRSWLMEVSWRLTPPAAMAGGLATPARGDRHQTILTSNPYRRKYASYITLCNIRLRAASVRDGARADRGRQAQGARQDRPAVEQRGGQLGAVVRV